MANRITKAALAYQAKAADNTLSWRQVADQTGFGCERDCRKQAGLYARRNDLTWPLGREPLSLEERQRYWSEDSKGSEAYALRAYEGLEWQEVADRLGGEQVTAYNLAERHALSRGLPWPCSSRAERERDALAELVFETALRERNVPGRLPPTWSEIGLVCKLPDPTRARELAEYHANKTGKEMPEHKNRAIVFGEECYRLRKQGLSWDEVAEKAGIKWKTHACSAAADYAKLNNLPWPLRAA